MFSPKPRIFRTPDLLVQYIFKVLAFWKNHPNKDGSFFLGADITHRNKGEISDER